MIILRLNFDPKCLFFYLSIYNIRLKARQIPILMNNKLKGCPNTPTKIKKGTDRKLTKKQQGKWQIKQDQTKQDETDNDYTRCE